MANTVTTSVKLPKTLNQTMLERVIAEGYGMRGKSKWMVEAIEHFLSLNHYPELVNIAEDIENLSEIVTLRLTPELAIRLDNAVIKVRKQFPALEGVKSNIIRASIFQRLLH